MVALVTVAEHDRGCRVVAVRKSGGTDLTLVKATTGFPGSCGMSSMFHLGAGFYGSGLPAHVREWALAFRSFLVLPVCSLLGQDRLEWEPGFRKGAVTDLTLVKETAGFAGL